MRQGAQGGYGGSCSNRNDFTTFFFANIPYVYGELDISKSLEDGLGLRKCSFQEGLINGGEDLGLLDSSK